jgi:hypothetical protein
MPEVGSAARGPRLLIVNAPLVVCWGLGQDSTGMLVGMVERGLRPDLIIFAEVGSERKGSYDFQPIFSDWIEGRGFPRPVTCRYRPDDYKHWPPYYTLLENCLTNVTLPSLAHGFHTCSAKWKVAPINRYIAGLPWARAWWAEGGRIRKAIGFDDTPRERRRAEKGCATFAISADEKDRYELVFLLQEWRWVRQDCVRAIERHGLPVPPKSSCVFCPAMKPEEVDTLEPDELRIIVVLEARTAPCHLDGAAVRGWPRGEGVPLIEGLWRRRVLGRRGATPKPGSMTEYIRENGLLPSTEIDRLIAATPSHPFTQGDFEALGYANWQEWLGDLIHPKPKPEPDEARQLCLVGF